MTQKLYNMRRLNYYVSVLFFVFVALSNYSCKDGELTDSVPDVDVSDADKTIELSRSDGTTTLQIPLSGEWTASAEGEWLTLITESGSSADAQVYNEQNDDDEDRSALVTYSAKDGSATYKVAFVQKGILSDERNADEVSDVEIGCGAGWGYNGYGMYADVSGMKGQIINSVKLKTILDKYPDEAEGNLLMVDDKSVNITSAKISTGSSSSDMTKALGVNAELDLDLPCGFSMNITANYDKKDLSNSEKNFSRRLYRHIFKQRHLDADNVSALFNEDLTGIPLKESQRILSVGFRAMLIELSNTTESNREEVVVDFIQSYGTHIITRGDIGGCYEYSMTTDKSDVSSDEEIKAALDMGYKKMFKIKGDASYENMEKKVGSNYTSSVTVKGGNSLLLAKAANNIEGGCSQADIDKWLETIKEGACTLVDFKLAPIWKIIPKTYKTSDGLSVSNIIKEYLTTGKILKTEEFKTYQLPTVSTPAATKFELPTINDDSTQVYTAWCAGQPVAEICKEYVPALSLRQRVVVVYPIKENKPDYKEGFFIGNEGHRAGNVMWYTENDSVKCKFSENTDYDLGEKIDSIYIYNNTISGHPTKGNGYGIAGTEPTYLRFYKGSQKEKGEYCIVKIGEQVYTRENIKSHYGFDGLSVDKMLSVIDDNGQFFYHKDCVSKFGIGDDTQTLTGYCLPSNDDFGKTLSSLSSYSSTFMQGGVSGLDLKCDGYVKYTPGTEGHYKYSWFKLKKIYVDGEEEKSDLEGKSSSYLITSEGWMKFLEGEKLEVKNPDDDRYPMRLRRIDGFSYQ